MTSVAVESAGQPDIRTYLKIFWRWRLLFLAVLVLVPLGAYLLERNKPKIYQSSTLLDASGSSLAVGASNLPSLTSNPQAVARLVTTDAVANDALRRLHPAPTSVGSLLREVTASADTTTGFLTITAQDGDPGHAAAIANAFAAALSSDQSTQANQIITRQLRVLYRQLAATGSSALTTRGALAQQIAQLKALMSSTSAGPRVIDAAVASGTPVGPNTRRAVELAFVIALLLGVGAVLIAENADRRLRAPEDLERLTGMALLGTIPRSAFSPDRYLTPRNIEAFEALRAALMYYNVDRPLGSVVVVSPGPDEGKTTVAIGLALATARAGGKAIIVDADLRRPQVSSRLGIPPADGLGSVLARERRLSEVLVEHPVDGSEGGQLLVLPAGPPPSNPSALVNSPGMRALLRKLEGRADLVIVDTAATLAVSDSLPLIQTASGIAMIVRMNRSSRAAVHRLQKVIASAHGDVLGTVATGSGGSGGYGYYETPSRASRRSHARLPGLRRRRSATGEGAVAASNGAGVARPDSSASEPSPLRTDRQTVVATPSISDEPAEAEARVDLRRPQTTAANGHVAPEPGPSANGARVAGPIASALRTSVRRRLTRGR